MRTGSNLQSGGTNPRAEMAISDVNHVSGISIGGVMRRQGHFEPGPDDRIWQGTPGWGFDVMPNSLPNKSMVEVTRSESQLRVRASENADDEHQSANRIETTRPARWNTAGLRESVQRGRGP